jgi:hypothetical protein
LLQRLGLVELLLGLGLVAERRADELDQRLAHQAGLARARHAGDAGEHPEREVDVELAQVVARDPLAGAAIPRGARTCRGAGR